MHLLLGRGWYSLQCSPLSGKGGGVGWAPRSFGSLPFREAASSGSSRSHVLCRPGCWATPVSVESPEKRLPLWAVGTLKRPALWLSRVLLDGLFPGGRENSEDCLLLQENPAVVLFPVSLEPAWGGGGGGQVHVCTGQATGKQCQGGGQAGGLIPLPHGSHFLRK